MPDIMIATPAFGEVFYTPYVQSMFRLYRAIIPKGWTLSFGSLAYADIAEARNFLLTHWFDKTKSSHLLFIDADMGFAPDLVFDMVAFKKPVVGAIYTRRQIDLNRLVKLVSEGERPARAIARAHDFIIRPLRSGPPRRINGFIEVEGCGAGLLLVQRACIETMLKKLPEISDDTRSRKSPVVRNLSRLIRAFDPLVVEGGRLSEDFSFCHRWRKCNGEIWARADKSLTHIGLHRFESRYSDVSTGTRITLKPEMLNPKRGSSAPVATPQARGQKERVNGQQKRENGPGKKP